MELWMLLLPMLSALLVLAVMRLLYQSLHYVWWTPRRLRILIERQGIKGPPPLPLLGNLPLIFSIRGNAVSHPMEAFHHNILPRIFPDHLLWSTAYGRRYVLWWAPEPGIVITETDMIKEILSQKNALTLGKPYLNTQRFLEYITGMGLIAANGETWANQRRISGPSFHYAKLKGFIEEMVSCTEEMLTEIDKVVGKNRAEIEIGSYMIRLTAAIIAHTQFGTSYEKGKEIFENIYSLSDFVFQNALYYFLPGGRYLPLPAFRQMQKLKKKVEASISDIVKERKKYGVPGRSGTYGNDLLGLMLAESEGEKEGARLSIQQLVDQCKTFFFAGHETVARSLAWTMLLLAHNPSWQERARAEVVCLYDGKKFPGAEIVGKMRILEMIIYETLRLYPPVPIVARQAMSDMSINDMFVPKGVDLVIPLLALHHDKDLWGEDVHDFNPERFANGLGKACKHPMGFLGFVHGPRNCIGQKFALMEAKVVLSMLLYRFNFYPSPQYKHAPHFQLTLAPQHGAQVILEAINHS